MKTVPSVDEHARYVLTEKGRLDLLCAPLCDCDVRLAGLLLECASCGTVYGSVRNWQAARPNATAKPA